VPGNHDVSRDFVTPDPPLWDFHYRLRRETSPVVWRDIVYTQLQKDPLHSMLAPLGAYNSFAQGFECATSAKTLAWNRVFDKTLEQDVRVRLHGLNSALISDEADAPGKLLLSE